MSGGALVSARDSNRNDDPILEERETDRPSTSLSLITKATLH